MTPVSTFIFVSFVHGMMSLCLLFSPMTSNYRLIWLPNEEISIGLLRIVEMSMNKIAL